VKVCDIVATFPLSDELLGLPDRPPVDILYVPSVANLSCVHVIVSGADGGVPNSFYQNLCTSTS
jgi:hypothetical protein